jgi:phage tail-like protein
MPAPIRHDPFGNFSFRVEIDGQVVAGFTEVNGLSSEIAVIEYREGGDQRIRKLPGVRKYNNLVLKRGITSDRSLWEWHQTAANGRVERRNGSVLLLDAERNVVARWNFHDAWPVKWQGPDLDGQSSDVAIETLELAHEGIDWAN